MCARKTREICGRTARRTPRLAWGIDPQFQAERKKRDKECKECDAKNKKRQGGARVAGVGQNTDTDTESDSDESDNDSDCSDQSVYDDEQATPVQSADVMLSNTFFTPGVSSTFDVPVSTGAARVAVGEERPAHSALAQARARAEMAHSAQLARDEYALQLRAQAEAARAAAAATLARQRAVAPSTPTAEVVPTCPLPPSPSNPCSPSPPRVAPRSPPCGVMTPAASSRLARSGQLAAEHHAEPRTRRRPQRGTPRLWTAVR